MKAKPAGVETTDRNWYKVATLVLSGVMVLLTFLSVVYYRTVDKELSERKTMEDKLSKLQNRLVEVKRIPKIVVEAITVKSSGLPESSFSSLPMVPAVIRLRHVEGETARGITVLVSSDSSIKEVKIGSQLEKLDIQRMTDGRSLLIDLPRLRSKSVVEVAIMQEALSEIEMETRLDLGIVINNSNDNAAQVFYEATEWARLARSESGLDEIDPGELSTTQELEAAIASIERSLRFREENVGYSPWKFLFGLLLVTVPVSLVIGTGISLAWNTLTTIMQRPLVAGLTAGNVKKGSTKDEVDLIATRWGRKSLGIGSSGNVDEIWLYDEVEKPVIGTRHSGVVLLWKEGKLVDSWLVKRR